MQSDLVSLGVRMMGRGRIRTREMKIFISNSFFDTLLTTLKLTENALLELFDLICQMKNERCKVGSVKSFF